MTAYVDGIWTSSDEARISVLDHGLLYGDGVFEGIRFYGGKAFLLEEHLRRLSDSARAIALDLPCPLDEIAIVCREAIERTALVDGYLRLIVTRGKGALGVSPHTCERPSLIVIGAALTLYPAEAYTAGITVVTASLRRANPDSLPPQIKSLNYLTNVLASIEARRQGAHEALILNAAGYVAECTADNIFVVRDGKLRTPGTADGALAGITRGLVLELASELGISASVSVLTLADVYAADELFLTGTGAEIVPVATIDGRVMPALRLVTERLRVAFVADTKGSDPFVPTTDLR